jgi:hypothetical protein
MSTIKRAMNQDDGVDVIETLKCQFFTGESNAHTFLITNADGSALSGTVKAVFQRSDGSTETITGSIASGAAKVVIPAACHEVPGTFRLTIYLINGTTRKAIYACIGQVVQSNIEI